jgi:hypothetical protein
MSKRYDVAKAVAREVALTAAALAADAAGALTVPAAHGLDAAAEHHDVCLLERGHLQNGLLQDVIKRELRLLANSCGSST